MTDIEMDLVLLRLENERLSQINRELAMALEKAQNEVCRMCRLACMAHKIEAKCNLCRNRGEWKNAVASGL